MGERVVTRGIILKRFPFGNTSLLLTSFTYSHGKVSFLAKGARLSKIKTTSSLETFIVNELTLDYVETREINFLLDSFTLWQPQNFKTSYKKFLFSSGILHFISKVLPPGAILKPLYSLTERSLYLIDTSPQNEETVYTSFLLKSAKIMGYDFKLNLCIKCNRSHEQNFLSIKGGGIFCHRCFSKTKSFGVPITMEELEHIDRLLNFSLSSITELHTPKETMDKIILLCSHLHELDIDPKFHLFQ